MHAPLTNLAKDLGPSTHKWWCDWRGETAAIVAGGPSVKDADLEQLRGCVKVMVINESHQLCPWADVLYGCDANWWKLRDYVKEFKGLKLTYDVPTAINNPPIQWISVRETSDEILVEKPGVVGAGGNSGFQALNLAVQFGVVKILLIGFDMRVDLGTHWHGRHPPGLSNPCEVSNLPRWIRALDGSFERLFLLGVKVINCSAVSALTTYPKMTIAKALHGG